MTIIRTDTIAKKDDDKHLNAVQEASHTADFYQNQHKREAVTVKEVALVYISFIMVFLCLSNFAKKKRRSSISHLMVMLTAVLIVEPW